MVFTVIHGTPPQVGTIDLVIALIVGTGVGSRSQLEPHSTLDGDLGWVAADRFDVSIACQDYFGIDIPIADALAWQSIADIARSLRNQCAAAGVPFFGKQGYRKQSLPADLQIREFPA